MGHDNLPSVTKELALDNQISKNDLIEVGVARLEQELEGRDEQLTVEMKKLNEEINELDLEIETEAQKTAEGQFDVVDLVKALEKGLDLKMKVKIEHRLTLRNPHDKEAEEDSQEKMEMLQCSLRIVGGEGSIRERDIYRLERQVMTKGPWALMDSMQGEDEADTCFINRLVVIKTPEHIVTLRVKREEKMKRYDQMQKDRNEIRHNLSNMNKYERKIKAQVTEQALSATDEGQALLDSINVDSLLKGVPRLQ